MFGSVGGGWPPWRRPKGAHPQAMRWGLTRASAAFSTTIPRPRGTGRGDWRHGPATPGVWLPDRNRLLDKSLCYSPRGRIAALPGGPNARPWTRRARAAGQTVVKCSGPSDCRRLRGRRWALRRQHCGPATWTARPQRKYRRGIAPRSWAIRSVIQTTLAGGAADHRLDTEHRRTRIAKLARGAAAKPRRSGHASQAWRA